MSPRVLKSCASALCGPLITQLQRQIFPHLPPEQFGFLKGSGTSDDGVSLASTITTAINNRAEV